MKRDMPKIMIDNDLIVDTVGKIANVMMIPEEHKIEVFA